jgi:hypothetical protein
MGIVINSSTGEIDVAASTPGTYRITYTTNNCVNSSTQDITINALPTVAISGTLSYCNGSNTTLTATAGLSSYLWSTGETTQDIDVTAGSYTVTGTDANGCSATSSSVTVAELPLDDASFSYSANSYCQNAASNPTPTPTTPGGTFSSTTGLSINSTTGEINLSASTVGNYVVTYNTPSGNACPNSSTQDVTVNALDNAAFSYSASSYEPTDADPTPTITGLTGGTFSGTTGLVINSTTGEIDLSASTEASHTVTYNTSTSGSSVCPNTSTFGVTIAVAGISNVYSMNFDGANDYLSAGSGSGITGSNPFSMSAWFKLASAPSGYPMIVSTGRANSTNENILYISPSYKLGWGNSNANADFPNSSGTTLSLNTWYHGVVTFNGSNTIKIYVNGSLDGSKTDVSGVNIEDIDIVIGARTNNGNTGKELYFNGSIDEVGIWNTALTAPQVAQIYNATSTGKTADLSTISGSNLKYFNRMGD